MKKKTKYDEAPRDLGKQILEAKEVADFLPPPELLVPKEEMKKVTLALSRKSIDFFKDTSKKTHIPYQQLIRRVLDIYTDHYAE